MTDMRKYCTLLLLSGWILRSRANSLPASTPGHISLIWRPSSVAGFCSPTIRAILFCFVVAARTLGCERLPAAFVLFRPSFVCSVFYAINLYDVVHAHALLRVLILSPLAASGIVTQWTITVARDFMYAPLCSTKTVPF